MLQIKARCSHCPTESAPLDVEEADLQDPTFRPHASQQFWAMGWQVGKGHAVCPACRADRSASAKWLA